MPSNVLHGDIPFTCLHPDKPLYPVPPRIFGCVCFVHDFTPGLDKLSPRSIKSVFLGYSRTQKGYRCLDPLTNRHYTCADVSFFELQPYFSPPLVKPSDTLVATPLPIPLPVSPNANVPSPKPLQVYTRRPRPELDSCLPPGPPTAAPSNPPPSTNDLPIALRKGICSCTNHPFSNQHK